MKKDYSEFQYTGYDYYRVLHENTQDLRFDFFHNYAYFSEEQKHISIHVDHSYEIDAIARHIAKYDKELAERNDKDYENFKERLILARSAAEVLNAENPEIMQSLSERYGDRICFAVELKEPPSPDPNTYWPPVNLLSASTLNLHYGEGLLDFLYADFKTPIEELIGWLKERPDEADIIVDDEEEDTKKIHTHTEDYVLDYTEYVVSFTWLHNILYKSLYTAICPPIIEDDIDQPKPLLQYAQ